MRLRHLVKQFALAIASLGITGIIVAGFLYAYVELQLPNVDILKNVDMQVPLRIYTRDGKLIAVYGSKRRTPVTLDQVPKALQHAVIATEDARFYSHPGVDLIGLVRAFRVLLITGRKAQGASTITMQVARNFFLTRKKTYSRKIKEILLALKIDHELSKDKILQLYLNRVYFGKGAYGVAAAAEVYYGKKLKQLSLPQMAMIAGLPQAPSRNNPINNPKGALKRRNHVLQRMWQVGYIDQQTYRQAIKTPITATYHHRHVQLYAPYVAEMVREIMVSKYGKEKAYDGGFSVYTTVIAKLQRSAKHALESGLLAYSERHGYHGSSKNLGTPSLDNRAAWIKKLKDITPVNQLHPAAVLSVTDQSATVLLADQSVVTIPWSGLSWARKAFKSGYAGPKPTSAKQIVQPGDVIWVEKQKSHWTLAQIPTVQGAIVSLNPNNGAILALSGGFDFRLSNFNRATQAERQPGSNFKPFIYAAALAKGFTLASMINDAPVIKKNGGENSLWRPHNDDYQFSGPTSLFEALTKSTNLVSIRLLQAIGVNYAVNFVTRFGFDPKQLPHVLSLALGSASLTPLQIARGYAVFANGGFRVSPFLISRIVNEHGKVLYQADPLKACRACIADPKLPAIDRPQPQAPEVLKPQIAYLITHALQNVIHHGTGRRARRLDARGLAGKTGTTNDKMDAWFSGFDSNVETTVWVGFDHMKSLHEYGSQAALPIWIDYMRTALSVLPKQTMPEPPNLVTVRIDPKNGLRATAKTQHAIFQVFRVAKAPTQYSIPGNTKQAGSNQNTEPTISDQDHLF